MPRYITYEQALPAKPPYTDPFERARRRGGGEEEEEERSSWWN
jgi:hypothetical protein